MSHVGKFLVVGGIQFVPTKQRSNGKHCTVCAFQTQPGKCGLDVKFEHAQGLDCGLDNTHYELAGYNELV